MKSKDVCVCRGGIIPCRCGMCDMRAGCCIEDEKHFCWESDCTRCALTPLQKADQQMVIR